MMRSKPCLAVVLLAVLLAWPASRAAARNLAPEVERFALEFFPWEPENRVTVKAAPERDAAGMHAYAIERKGKYEKLDTKTTFYITPDEKLIFTGSVIKNSANQEETRPIRTNQDVVGVAGYFSKLFRARARAFLDPNGDRGGLKAVTVEVDTGFFSQPLHEFIATDGSYFFQGELWKLDESVASQRRAIMDLSDSPAEGVAQPKITMVEYADMECPFCKKRGLQMDELMKKYAQRLQIRRYYKYYPLWVNHVWSTKAASAAVCLSKTSPDLVFKFKKLCYEHQETLTVAGIDEQAFNFVDASGVPRNDFVSCYLKEASFAPIRRDMDEGVRLGVMSTPTYYLNGVEIYWLPDEVMEDYLKTLLGGAAKKK
jgi:protein-disulfide isomerase